MSIQQSYGSFVNKLPIANKAKAFMKKNWVGGLIGFSVPIITYLFSLKMGYSATNTPAIINTLFTKPIQFLDNLFYSLGWYGSGFISPTFFISIILIVLGYMVFGIFVQHFGRKLLKK